MVRPAGSGSRLAAGLAAGVATQFGVFQAVTSARDPKYVVVPQPERLGERQPVS